MFMFGSKCLSNLFNEFEDMLSVKFQTGIKTKVSYNYRQYELTSLGTIIPKLPHSDGCN